MRFEAVSGRVDRADGLAVRPRDAGNYYVARANALVDGDRQQIAGASAKVSSGEWHTLVPRAEGDRLTVAFDGKPLLAHRDHTFTGLGKVALWTKADSATHFDRLTIKPLRSTP